MTREEAIQIAHEEWHTPGIDVAISLVRMLERLGVLKVDGPPLEDISAVKVRIECNLIHATPEEWAACKVCEATIKRATGK